MRQRHLWWVLCVLSPAALSNAACGDDEVGIGEGGAGGDGPSTVPTEREPGSTGGSSDLWFPPGVRINGEEGGSGGAGSTGGAGGFGAGSAGGAGGALGGGGTGGAGGAIEGTGGAGGAAPSAFEACPGEAIQVSTAGGVSILASTTGRTSDYDSFCVPTGSPDVVYQLDLAEPCTLSVSLVDSNGLDAALSLRRSQCSIEVGGSQCFDLSTDDEQFVQHEDAGTLWLVVEGASGSAGDFELNIQCDTPTCGDGVWNPGEQCDPGPGVPLDGCGDPGSANECQEEAADAADTCAGLGAAFSIPSGSSAWPATDPIFSNADASDDYQGPCAPGGEVGGKDEVFAFIPESSGTITIQLGADRNGTPYCQTFLEMECWYRIMYVREGDCTSGATLGCDEIDFGDGMNELTFDVTAGQTYFLFVDGLNDQYYSYGPYLIQFDRQ